MLAILVEIFRIFYECCLAVTHSHGWALLLMSVLTAFASEPLKRMVEGVLERERKLRAIIDPKLAEIQKGYAGEERHRRIAALYRKYSYNPIFALRASLGFLIQIPFLYAAYAMLSNYPPLTFASFGRIVDLSRPDGLLAGINALPLLMTALNLEAVALTPNQGRKERIQGAIIAGIFLVLLYSAPSALLIYWTANNAIYVLRGLYARYSSLAPRLSRIRSTAPSTTPTDERTAAVYAYCPPLCFAVTSFSLAYCLTLEKGSGTVPLTSVSLLSLFLTACCVIPVIYQPAPTKRALVTMAALLCAPWLALCIYQGFTHQPFTLFLLGVKPYFPLLTWQLGLSLVRGSGSGFSTMGATTLVGGNPRSVYTAAGITLGVMIFLFGPMATYMSSAAGFDLEADVNVIKSLVLVFLCYCAFLYVLWFWLPSKLSSIVALCALLLSLLAFLEGVVFVVDFGALDSIRFQVDPNVNNMRMWMDYLIYGLMASIMVVSAVFSLGGYFTTVCWLLTAALLAFCGQILFMKPQDKTEFRGAYTLSRTEPNYLLIMSDAYTGEYFRDCLEDWPELAPSFRGFTWYEDTLADGNCTLLTLPALLGGIDYSPANINRDAGRSRLEKCGNAFSRLPNLVLGSGGRVTMTDPGFWVMMPDSRRNLAKQFSQPEKVSLLNPESFHEPLWREFLSETDPAFQTGRDPLQYVSFLLSTSLFRFVPRSEKLNIYNCSNWLVSQETLIAVFHPRVSQRIAMLACLSRAFRIDDGPPSLSIVLNAMTHRPYYLGPDSLRLEKRPLPPYDTTRHATRFLADFLDWMRREGVYDNTFIVIASDHSTHVGLGIMPRSITDPVLGAIWTELRPNALLLVKPFGSTAPLATSSELMLASDVYGFLASAIDGTKPSPAESARNRRSRTFCWGLWRWSDHPRNTLLVQEMDLSGSMFEKENWLPFIPLLEEQEGEKE